MENLLRNGDYVPDGFGGFCRKDGREGLLCEALFRLCVRRGSFPFLPELGSRLYTLGREKRSEREALAMQYCREALSPLGLSVQQVTVTEVGERQFSVAVGLSLDEQFYTLEVSA